MKLGKAGSRRPILYLRSFQIDDRLGRRVLGALPRHHPFSKYGAAHGQRLPQLRSVIAIGRPDEKLPARGAARFYVSHDLWKQKVADVAEASQLVLWATGITEGLRWEISHLVDKVPPSKLILWAHPHLLPVSPLEREAEWSRFLDALGRHFPVPLPATLGDTRFFYFTPDWQPHAVAPPRTGFIWALRSFFNAQSSALRALLGIKKGELKAEAFASTGTGTSRRRPISLSLR